MSENTKNNKGLLLWLALMFCFLGIPLLLFSAGIIYLNEMRFMEQVSSSKTELGRTFEEFYQPGHVERSWCRYFNETFSLKSKICENNETLNHEFNFLRKELGIDFLLYDVRQKQIQTSFDERFNQDKKHWKIALNAIARKFLLVNSEFEPTREEEKALGRVFGPQFNYKHLKKSFDNELMLAMADSRNIKPKFWSTRLKNRLIDKLIIIFVPDRLLNDSIFARFKLARYLEKNPGQKFSYVIESNETSPYLSPDLIPEKNEIDEYLKTHESLKRDHVVSKNFAIFPMFLKPGLFLHGFVRLSTLNKSPWISVVTPFFFLLIYGIFLGKYYYRILVKEEPDSLSLRWKLRFLFFFANGLPLVVLFFIGNDYLNQKRETILKEVQSKSIRFLQNLDEKFETEYAKRIINKSMAFNTLKEQLKTEKLNNKNLKEFIQSLEKPIWKVLMVASSSSAIGTNEGMVDMKAGIVPEAYKKEGEKGDSQIKFVRKIGQFFLGVMNKTKISSKDATEMEMVVESFTQKPLQNFIHDILLEAGNFTMWGFGDNIQPSILGYFTIGNNKNHDYFYIMMWRRIALQAKFLRDNFTRANRNTIGIKVIATNSERKTFFPRNIDKDMAVMAFEENLTEYPSNDFKFLNYENQKCMAIGFKGKHIDSFKLIGLFPLEIMEKQISTQRKQLLIFAFLSILMAFGLSQILAQSFLSPLNSLSEGASAIEAKNFHHRLPDLGRDEFAEMGEIFNNVMVDLEELSVGSAIQEQLLPQGDIETGNFSLYGKSIPMAELGGDYFDFIEQEDNTFSVLLGDVAGHGVGAALIMAMAKAVVVQSDHLLDKPLEMITRLHNLILASKTKKQRKIMTCQYLFLDGKTGKGVYTNAGACSPYIIRHSRGTIEELTLAGAALGAFKKAKFSELELQFEPGDAIVFYTDGIVETRSKDDEEIGYEGLQEILKASWDLDAEKFYQNIYETYMNHLGDQGAQDDLTMVVLVYNPKNAK